MGGSQSQGKKMIINDITMKKVKIDLYDTHLCHIHKTKYGYFGYGAQKLIKGTINIYAFSPLEDFSKAAVGLSAKHAYHNYQLKEIVHAREFDKKTVEALHGFVTDGENTTLPAHLLYDGMVYIGHCQSVLNQFVMMKGIKKNDVFTIRQVIEYHDYVEKLRDDHLSADLLFIPRIKQIVNGK